MALAGAAPFATGAAGWPAMEPALGGADHLLYGKPWGISRRQVATARWTWGE